MSGLDRSLVQLLEKAMRGRLADMHFMLPAQVVSYDGQFVQVNVMVQQPVFNDDNQITGYEKLPTLGPIPVSWPRFGGFYLSGPLAANDEGMVLFASTPIGEWRSTGQSSQPQDASRHSNGYPVFVPALFNDTRPLPDGSARAAGVVLGKEGSSEQLIIQSGLIQAGASGANPLPTQADYNALLTAVSVFLAPTNWVSIGSAATAAAKLLTDIQGTGPEPCKPVFTTLFKAK